VPTYEYECDACHRVFEVRQRITEAPLTACDACGGSVHRLLSAAPFILKGEGWYVTDYPSEARKKALASEKPAAKADGTKTDGAQGDGAKKSDGAKSDGGAKSESPSTTSSSTPSAASSSSASSKAD
jgi:putative FmdB family regulatory protein